ncbi:MAG: AraC family transcriptional regulator [Clostridia bacterium]|nr:AraC family transcriptional regulator [Clostridia bacterium]
MFVQCDILDEKYTKLRPLNLGHEDCQSKHTFGPAVRTYWLLHYVVSGKGKYIVNDTEYAVYPGQAFLIRPGEITTYQADEKDPWHYVWSAFDADIDKLFELPYILDIPELKAIFQKIFSEFDFSIDNQSYAIARIWEIVGCLTNNSFTVSDSPYVTKALNIIRSQYMLDISVQSVARELGLDRSYFSNIFKKETNVSPGQFIMDCRMQKAFSLLMCEKYSVSVVAASVGYTDLFSFSRSFKKYYGVPPQRYKEIDPNELSFTI